MNWLHDIAAYTIALMLIVGALATLIGALGLLRFASFFDRLHMTTFGTSLATTLIMGGSLLFSWFIEKDFELHQLVLWLFVTITTPVSFLLLAGTTRQCERLNDADAVQHLAINPAERDS